MTEYYHTLIEKGGKVLRSYGDVVLETDYQILGHKDNEAQSPPDKKWIGWKTVPYPHPTFVRLPQVRCTVCRKEHHLGPIRSVSQP